MKKRRILSATLAVLMVLSLLPLGVVGITAAEAGTLPPTLPGDPTTVYKWGHYPNAEGVTQIWTGTELGTLGAGKGTAEDTWDKAFVLQPILEPNVTLTTTTNPDTADLVAPSYEKDFGTMEAKLPANAKGLMLKLSTNGSYSGFTMYLTFDGLRYTYHSKGNGTYNGKIYYYDYATSAWKVEATAGTHGRLPLNYDGYVYIPFDGFYINGGGLSDTTLADNMDLLTEKGISKLTYSGAAWNNGASVNLESINVVTLSDRIVSAAPILTDGVDLKIRSSVRSGAENATMIFEVEDLDEPVVVSIDNPAAGNNYFVLRNVLKPQNLTRNIRMTLKVDGETVDVVENYCIRDYAMKKLSRETTSKTLAMLIVDLLAYGAEVQQHTDYKTDDLATALLSDFHLGMISPDPMPETIDYTKQLFGDTADCHWKTFSLILNNEFSLRLTFEAPSIEGKVVKFGNSTFTPVATATEGVYSVRIDGVITAKTMNTPYEVCLYDTATGTSVGEGMTISASAYIHSLLNNPNAAAEDQFLAGKAYNFGLSATMYAPTVTLDEEYVVQFYGTALTGSDLEERTTATTRFLEELELKTGLRLTTGSGSKAIKVTSNGFNTKTGYEIWVEDDAIVVDCYDPAKLDDAYATLVSLLSTSGSIEASYSGVFGAPLYYGAGTLDSHIYSAANESYMMYVYDADQASFETYCEELVDYGYELFTENRMGETGSESIFATYRNAYRTVYVVWNPVDSFIRITESPASYFVPDGQRDEYVAVVDSTVAQLAREDVVNAQPGNAVGLGLIWQLADGRFIMVDGGPNYAGTDIDLTYNYLMAHKPAEHEQPVIAAWFFTHEHGDHTWMAQDFINKYHEKVEIELIGVNFPDFEEYYGFNSASTYTSEHTGYTKGTLGAVQQFYPDATVWIMRAGQKHWIANAEIEVIISHEDLYDMAKNIESSGRHVEVNDSDCVFRITVAGTSTMVLGDSEGQGAVNTTTGVPTSLYLANDLMPKWYGSYLESDYLQTAHHGINEGLLLYQAVNPTAVFWPTTAWSACNQNRLANKWLYSGVSYNGLTTRATKHYFSMTDTIITLEKCPGKIELPMMPI